MSLTSYDEFLATKRRVVADAGFAVRDEDLHPGLFPFQRDLVRWAARKGRAALFADTGLGKTRMQVEWSRLAGVPTLILAPLSVARQTVREAERIGVEVVYARRQEDAGPITITNYEMLDRFEPSAFGAVVLDESGILKNFEGKVRSRLISAFRDTPLRLCCTATPAPNDIAELANHAEFLGVCSRVEMLSQYFVHDDAGWRLKGHAREPFYRWLASWGMSLKRPSDLGYSDEGFTLPPLSIEPVIVETQAVPTDGRLFFGALHGIQDRVAVRRATMAERCQAAAGLVMSESDEPWLIWVGLNEEGREMKRLLPDAVLVEGSDTPEAKAEAAERFISGECRRLISKGTIFGFGSNFQHCARTAFVGIGDSFEQYYQMLRRFWRYGQKREVRAFIILSDAEETVYANVLRKEREAEETARELIRHVAEFEREEVQGAMTGSGYAPGDAMRLPAWLV